MGLAAPVKLTAAANAIKVLQTTMEFVQGALLEPSGVPKLLHVSMSVVKIPSTINLKANVPATLAMVSTTGSAALAPITTLSVKDTVSPVQLTQS